DRLRDHLPFQVHIRVQGGLWPTHVWESRTPARLAVPFGTTTIILLGLLVWGILSALILRVIYRNPVVIAVARDPSALRRLPLSQLGTANRALHRAGRLRGAVAAAAIPAARWKNAVRAAENSAPAVAAAFASAIGANL